jgi:hypothetical protein
MLWLFVVSHCLEQDMGEMHNIPNFVPILDCCYITEQAVNQSSSQNEANICPLK